MRPEIRTTSVWMRWLIITLLGVAWSAPAHTQETKTPYPAMAPLDQYLMEQNAEAALARCAALESISRDAEIMALGRHGYETVAKGKNGFVCMVLRSWTSGINEPEFWNPKIRSAICFNPAAARTYLPIIPVGSWSDGTPGPPDGH